MKKNILIATGGTGGHVIPGTVFYKMVSKKSNAYLCTDLRGNAYINERIRNLKIINTPKIFSNYYFMIFNIFKILKVTIEAIIYIKKKKIDLILSTGGYPTIPVCLAAVILKVKLYLYEPNAVIGKANNFFSFYCHKIFAHNRKIKKLNKKYKSKLIIIDPIVRKEFYSKFKKKKKIFSILIIGGSQGAKIFDFELNKALIKLSNKKRIRIIHQTSRKNLKFLKNFYSKNKVDNLVFNYKKRIFNIFRETDFCITRAGASTLFELVVLKIPFLAIPLKSSKDNHQLENARFHANKNYGWILEEKNFNEKTIYLLLKKIILNQKNFFNKKNKILDISKNFNFKNQSRILLKEIAYA